MAFSLYLEPISSRAFDQALQGHLERLSPEVVRDFRPSTPAQVRRAADQYDARCNKQRRSVDHVRTLIAPLQQLSATVGAHDDDTAVVWGALRYVVEAIAGLTGFVDRIGAVFALIAADLPVYQGCAARVHAHDPMVLQALAGVYSDILAACATVRELCQRGPWRTGSAALRWCLPRAAHGALAVRLRALNPCDHTFGAVTASLRRRRKILCARADRHQVRVAPPVVEGGGRVFGGAGEMAETGAQRPTVVRRYWEPYARHCDPYLYM